MWVQGNVVRMQFGGGGRTDAQPLVDFTPSHRMGVVEGNAPVAHSDLIGFPGNDGMHFWCSWPGQTNTFYAPIPSPVWRDGTRATLAMVGFLLWCSTGVEVTSVQVFDGPNHLVDVVTNGHITGSLSGSLVENVNRFDLPSPLEVSFGICVCFTVNFGATGGSLTFNAVGADFNV
jgi:hypothetical protein